MSLLPTLLETIALVLALALPLVLLAYAQIPRLIPGAGARFQIASATVAALFILSSIALPGPLDPGDVLSGALLLAAAILFWYVIWSLLAWGFTLTLLTALAQARRPLTEDQWISAYMRGGDLSTFAHNRLQLLLGSGLARANGDRIVATAAGKVTARFVRLVRFVLGVGLKQ